MQKWLGNLTSRFSGFASSYEDQGLYELAEIWGQQCSKITRIRSGVEHLRHLYDVASSLNRLANLYSFQGRYTEAEPLYQQALKMKKQLLGAEHPNVAASLNNLVALYYFQGRYTEAEPLYQQALEMYNQLLGTEHPYSQTAWKNYLYFLQQVLRENRQEDLSDERSLQIISDMEKSSLENS